MRVRQDSIKMLLEQFLGGEFTSGNRQRRDGHIDAAVVQALQQSGGNVFDNLHGDERMPGSKTLEQLGQEGGRDGRNDTDHDIALLVAGHLLQFGLRLFELAENPLRLGQESLAEYGELGRAW